MYHTPRADSRHTTTSRIADVLKQLFPRRKQTGGDELREPVVKRGEIIEKFDLRLLNQRVDASGSRSPDGDPPADRERFQFV